MLVALAIVTNCFAFKYFLNAVSCVKYFYLLCDPSQKGLLFDLPQRHKNILSAAPKIFPSTPLTLKLPSIINGPLAISVIFVLFDIYI